MTQPCLLSFNTFSFFLVLVMFAEQVTRGHQLEATENDHDAEVRAEWCR